MTAVGSGEAKDDDRPVDISADGRAQGHGQRTPADVDTMKPAQVVSALDVVTLRLHPGRWGFGVGCVAAREPAPAMMQREAERTEPVRLAPTDSPRIVGELQP